MATTRPPAFKPRNKTEARLHDEWIARFCAAGCPLGEFACSPAKPWRADRCTATGREVHFMDVEADCPRRDELCARRHAENVARSKREAAARRAGRAAHPKDHTPLAVPEDPELARRRLLAAIEPLPPADHSDLY